ncbi:hypothetical protein X765_24345 [Mesorhizobium sp. LSHC440B00]|nr:hypothetical protein X765_24345 [Mesorhizobium sp. LSHC440B00]ESX68308.1 hypothetical protein X757_27970 [Mesorhizobium sp. LSHC414A00]
MPPSMMRLHYEFQHNAADCRGSTPSLAIPYLTRIFWGFRHFDAIFRKLEVFTIKAAEIGAIAINEVFCHGVASKLERAF